MRKSIFTRLRAAVQCSLINPPSPSSSTCSPSSRWSSTSLRSFHHLRIFLIAGEPSGDIIGARLMAALKGLRPSGLKFAGVGGVMMEREGLVSEFPMEDITVMGVMELIPHLYRLKVCLNQTLTAILNFRPQLVVTIDSKGFSFRVLRHLKSMYAEMKQACPICIHYVAPSAWAWKGGEERLKNLAGLVDHMLCILPFEESLCRTNGLAATFVGHPVLEDAYYYSAMTGSMKLSWQIKGDGKEFRKKHGLSPDATLLSLLPGSRMQEVKRMLPIFGKTIQLLAEDRSDLAAVIPIVPNKRVTNEVEAHVKRWKTPIFLLHAASDREKYDAFDASNAGICTSGTAVLQMQIASLPCIVAYRANIVTEWLIQYLTKLHYISLPNILLDSRVIPEALFASCTPEKLASLIRPLLSRESLRQQQIEAAKLVIAMLSPTMEAYECPLGGNTMRPSLVAANTILNLLD